MGEINKLSYQIDEMKDRYWLRRSFIIWYEYAANKYNIGVPQVGDEEEEGHREREIWANNTFARWGDISEWKYNKQTRWAKSSLNNNAKYAIRASETPNFN